MTETIAVPDLDLVVDAVLDTPAAPTAVLAFAHGAGADMRHGFMAGFAARLAGRGVAVLRFQFPYTQAGRKAPDRPPKLIATLRAAVAAAAEAVPDVPLIAGGKSMGGRMAALAMAEPPGLPGVRGTVFAGFPLHPAGKPSTDRAAALDPVPVPMLFLQGDRDRLAEPALLGPVLDRLGDRATRVIIAEADHGFHVPKRTGLTDADILDRLADATADWIGRL
jgi:predicted alpha/beta-hydrolase family hydrolase